MPFVINKALKDCDIIIAVPDEVVFNYFSIRFIFKKVILSNKLITGFSKDMINLGAIYSFEIDLNKYAKKILDFLQKNNLKSQIILPDFDEIKFYKNKKLLKCVR